MTSARNSCLHGQGEPTAAAATYRMVFTRMEKIVLITSSIIFSLFFIYIFYKIGKMIVSKMRLNLGSGARGEGRGGGGGGSLTTSPSERRVQRLLDRPGVRDILATRINSQMETQRSTCDNQTTSTTQRRPSATAPPPNYDDITSLYSLGDSTLST